MSRAIRRERLLFISPVMPAESGNGLAMRAGLFLEALASEHDVSLLVVPVTGAADASAVPCFVTRHARRVVVLSAEGRSDSLYGLIARIKDPAERAQAMLAYPRPLLCRFATSAAIEEAAGRLPDPFDVVHVCRLYMAPFARPFLSRGGPGARPRGVLDLDDDEPRTRRRLSALHAERNQAMAAAVEGSEAGKYESLEREWAPRFDRVLVCSDTDREALLTRSGATAVEVVPNAVRAPSAPPPAGRDDEAHLLLVGSFGYFPNEDAALFFGEEIWPRLVSAADCPARLSIVGSRPSPAVRRLGETPGIIVTGEVPSVTPYYDRAQAAINPIRAGGGTRIKAIEAFAHRVPLVSTTIGAEGLEATHGRHLLVADGAEDFARACLRLVREPDLRERLASAAHDLYRERYSSEPVIEWIRQIYRALGRRGVDVDGDG